MRNLFLVVFCLFAVSTVQAADVNCSCDEPNKCSDIAISFVDSQPGVYMTVEYASGKSRAEGYARVVRDGNKGHVRYALGNFILVEKDGKYTMPGRLVTCN